MSKTLDVYRRDGVALVRAAFDGTWVNRLRKAVDRAIATPGPFSEDYVGGTNGGRFFESTYLWRQFPEFREFAFQSPAAAIAQAFICSRTVSLFYDQIFVKEPGTSTRTPWHQDLTYWAIRGSQICSLWLALDDTPRARCVEFVAGSHRWEASRARHFGDNSPYSGQEALPDLPEIDVERERILAWDLSPGDCLVFDPLTVHGSPGNASRSARRRAVSTRWIGEDVCFQVTGEFAFPKGDLRLSDGDPLPGVLAPRVILDPPT